MKIEYVVLAVVAAYIIGSHMAARAPAAPCNERAQYDAGYAAGTNDGRNNALIASTAY